jgi:hypothetical protein
MTNCDGHCSAVTSVSAQVANFINSMAPQIALSEREDLP